MSGLDSREQCALPLPVAPKTIAFRSLTSGYYIHHILSLILPHEASGVRPSSSFSALSRFPLNVLPGYDPSPNQGCKGPSLQVHTFIGVILPFR